MLTLGTNEHHLHSLPLMPCVHYSNRPSLREHQITHVSNDTYWTGVHLLLSETLYTIGVHTHLLYGHTATKIVGKFYLLS